MKKYYWLAASLIVATVLVANAQPPSPPDILGPDPVPVDGGASLLLLAGAAYGRKKLLKARKK